MNRRWLAVGLMALLLPSGALAGQKKSKSKDQKKNQPTVNADALLPDPQRIDHEISEMLGAWQVGDTNLMHSFYADDVTIVSGEYEPPLMGWAAYLTAYQRQRERLSSLRLDRHNSYIYTRGGVAWATYQWEFQALVDGKPSAARGHTTLVLVKQGDRWLIIHNHTSAVCDSISTAPPSPHPGS